MLGQIRIEFIFGVIVFTVIIFFIVTQTNTLFSSMLADSKSDALKAKATNVIQILVEDKGDPTNWDTIAQNNPNGVKRIGLADSPYNLSKTKVLNLSYNCSGSDPYKNILLNFNLNAYRIRVFNSTHQILSCGLQTSEPGAVTETRYIFIDNGYGKLVLELW
jgi:hypothetical protein